MHHRIAHLDPGRITVEQDTADFQFQQRSEFAELLQVARFGDQGGGELTVQTVQGFAELGLIGDFDDHGGRAEHFFLQHRVALEQQADIGLEQLRPGLMALLFTACQMRDARMRLQCLQAFGIAA